METMTPPPPPPLAPPVPPAEQTPVPPPPPGPLPGIDRREPGGRPRGRTLWLVFGSLLLLATLGWGTFNAVDLLAHEEYTRRFTVPAAELTGLYVDNDRGSITIVGTDADEVSVEAEISEGLRATGFDQQVVDSTLELRGSCAVVGATWCRVTYRIEVPRGLDLEVNSDDGRVELSDIDGDVVLDNDNGRVELSSISGSVVVDGDNGRVTGRDLSGPHARISADNGSIELAFTAPPDSVVADSDNGSIEILVPPVEVGYDVEAETDNGSQQIDVRDDPDSPHALRLRSDNGSVTVRYSG